VLLVLTWSCFALFAAALGTRAAGAAATKPNPPWKGLPTRTTVNPRSGAGNAINVAFEGPLSRILGDFNKIGWVRADPLSLKNDDRLARAALHHGKYPTAPVSRQYLFGRIEDFAVERELGSVSMRDHARFWDTGKQDPSTHLELWIGAASRDIAIKIVRKHRSLFGTTHKIDGHIDTERNLIVTSMQKVRVVSTVIMEPGVGHVTNMRTGGGDLITTDGKAALIVLK
jgi:hypothetical protein